MLKRTGYDSKVNEIKGEMPSIIGLATIASLNDVKNKIPNVSDLVKKKKKKNQVIMQKYQKFETNILLLLIIISSRVIHFVQR